MNMDGVDRMLFALRWLLSAHLCSYLCEWFHWNWSGNVMDFALLLEK